MQKEISDSWSFEDINEFCKMLEQTGELDELELKIFKAMLFLDLRKETKDTIPRLPASMIAERSGIPATNVYKYLYNLQEKGLIESSDGKNKVFWISRSSNPFPRIFGIVSRKFLAKKSLFNELEKRYENFIKHGPIWGGEKFYQQYKGSFADKASQVIDVSKDEILITTSRFFDDVMILDAIKRAIERGVKIRMITGEINSAIIDKLKSFKIGIRLGRVFPYMILADRKHGVTVDQNEEGILFLNMDTDYQQKFEEFWGKADVI